MAVNNEEAIATPLSEGDLKKVYYENFIDDLTDEELMYKKTVEDLFYIYKSFGFIYSIIKKANLLLSKESFDMFLKSLVSFIDELFLNNPNLFDSEGNDVNQIFTNKEIGGGGTKKRKGEFEQTYIVNNSDNNSFMSILSKTYIEELLKDINNIDPNFNERNAQDYLFITKHILKMKNTLEVEHVKNRIDKLKNILNVGKTIFHEDEVLDDNSNDNDGNKKIKVHDHIDQMIEKLKTIGPSIVAIFYKQSLWYKQIVNKSEYDSLNSILNLDVDADNKVVESTYADVILLLGDKMTQNKDLIIAKEKLERLKTNYDAEIQRKLQQEMELSKKLEDKRKAVQFIIDRYNEYTWFDKNSPKKHSFYIIGINPRTTTEEQLKSCGKRLKHILHPDKEPDKEWKKKAESAFKEASLAILGCQQEFKTKILKNLEPGPPAPYLALIGIETASDTNGVGGSGVGPTSGVGEASDQGTARLPQYYPTQAYYPKFDLKCVDQKIGTILIDVKCPVQLGVVKKLILYVHRPIYGAEPLNLIPEDSFLSHKMEQNVNVKNLNQSIEARVDFVQPLEIAASTKYYIGIQLIAERGNTMINWNSINITLHKFSNKNIIKKLLSSFKNASFINQAQLNVVLSNENKEEMTKYLNECIAAAKIWAQTV
ncbi:conserved Plasmodium protein, unknown function [Plasmodium knowlesi strain H]|uniref:DnaJ protein n=3 Tax=Plasmodium knowlesi TaxID=5850 RepID=A0A5K1UDD6_PLAKH|nr:conserved protein, unknown function [Plasmodium knowlesi strain H]OTN67234.1 Uncharacterized protein PKNOH_S06417300 [Plasmodium knowlesi]CAA9987446.1 conserved protein, unknown function [Plasmodium knowlesi strain H]SBO23245.1 conserved Plasmodium protein, unknown function [Plasmodium knowlesi strain H]SBO24121.1 conserved Plasmodium protein, unknown function [Plasmodium knowlesi strain H]VVS76920.1 conserved protein, unknown function [Plasmodium knowlesi strain H]|eukprot:XP_002258447.1 hypothetical protein, conserved in Plasmodium species [Plasmodium knowlesi strain H]